MTVSRDGLATVGNKRVNARPDGLETTAPTTNALLQDVLTELRRIRLGLQLQTDNELNLSDTEGT